MDQQERRENARSTVQKLLHEWREAEDLKTEFERSDGEISFPQWINEGECETFAEAVVEELVRLGDLTAFSAQSDEWTTLDADDCYHVWVVAGGLHFDSETPLGVADYMDLPFFGRAQAAWGCKRMHSKEREQQIVEGSARFMEISRKSLFELHGRGRQGK